MVYSHKFNFLYFDSFLFLCLHIDENSVFWNFARDFKVTILLKKH